MAVRKYRMHTGTWAFLLHRLSGVLLILYLPLHIWVLHHLSGGPGEFDEVMAGLDSPLFHLAEWGLLGVVLFHTLNGTRLLLVDLGWATSRQAQQRVFWVILALGLIVWSYSSMEFLRFVI